MLPSCTWSCFQHGCSHLSPHSHQPFSVSISVGACRGNKAGFRERGKSGRHRGQQDFRGLNAAFLQPCHLEAPDPPGAGDLHR